MVHAVLFAGRTMVPKTLIFAKDDSHAEDIVHIVREVFGKGNDFAKKITYRAYNPALQQNSSCGMFEPPATLSKRRAGILESSPALISRP